MSRYIVFQIRIIDIATDESFVTDNTISGLAAVARIIAALRASDKPYRVVVIVDGREIALIDGMANLADAYATATARPSGGQP